MVELSMGQRGARVRTLQQWLRQAGFRLAVEERQAELFGPSTEEALSDLQERLGLEPTGEFSAADESAIRLHLAEFKPPAEFHVRGVIRHRDGRVVPGAVVTAEDVDLFSVQPLGTTRTDTNGAYAISFKREQMARAERIGPDLRIRVAPPDGTSVASEVVFNSDVSAVIDFVLEGGVYAGQSEWERVVAAIVPLLGKHPASRLTSEHVRFLVEETDFPAELLNAFIAAVHAEARAHELGAPLAAEAAYAAIRQGGPSELVALALSSDRQIGTWLQRALGSLLPSYDCAWLEATKAAWRKLRAAAAGKTRLADLASLAGLASPAAARFAAQYHEHRGRRAELWTSLERDSELAASIPTLKRLGTWATFAQGHVPMVQALEQRFQRTQSKSIGAMLAGVDQRNWRELVREAGAPRGQSEAEFADALAVAVEDAYPTHVVLRDLHSLDISNRDSVGRLLQSHADQRNLAEEPIAAWLPKDDATPPEVIAEAERLQRLYKVAGRSSQLAPLIARGYTSAAEIVRRGRSRFAAEAKADGQTDPEASKAVFDRAVRQHEGAVLLWSRYDTRVNRPVGPVEKRPTRDLPDGIRKAEELFDSLAFCGCEECRSVYSPAAYLTDLLAFTEGVHVEGALTSRDFLYSYNAEGPRRNRRADLGLIELTCENTNRVLPTIDLVNELLEVVALGPARLQALGLQFVSSYQTTRPTEELLVAPEHIQEHAYDDVLAKASYPMSLPFDLGIVKARIFLRQLDAERRLLLEIFDRPAIDRAVEELSLAPADVDLIVKADEPTHDLYGLGATVSFADPLVPGAPVIQKPWLEYVRFAKHFLAQLGLEQAELLELRDSRFVEALGGPTLNWPGADCNLDRATWANLDDKRARAIVGVVRIARRSGLSFREIDAFSDARAKGALFSADALSELGLARRIARQLAVPFLDALRLWSPFDTKRGSKARSQYEECFLGLRVAAAEQKPFALAPDGRELLDTTPALRSVAATVAGAVELTLEDLLLLLDEKHVPDQLNLAGLSRLRSFAVLSQGTKLTVSELVSVIGLGQDNPFEPTETAGFLNCVSLVRASDLGIDDIEYLLVHEASAATRLDPREPVAVALLTSVRDDLKKLASSFGDESAKVLPPEDPTFVRLSTQLQTVVAADVAMRLQSTVAELAIDPAEIDLRKQAIKQLVEALSIGGASFTTPTLEDELVADLIDDALDTAQLRAQRLWRVFADLLRRKSVATQLATAVGLDPLLVAELLQLSAPATGTPRIDAFALTADSFLDSAPVTRSAYQPWFDSYLWLHKVALLVTKLKLSPVEVGAWLALEASGWLSLENIPIDAATAPDPKPAFAALRTALSVIQNRDWVQAGQTPLLVFLASLDSSGIDGAARLGELTGSSAAAAAASLGAATNGSLIDGELLRRIRGLCELASATGAPPATLAQWAGATLTAKQANEIVGALKSRIATKDWPRVARPLQDRLREAQRDALVSYICARDRITRTVLSERLLIDVEMAACQLTSRIRQALNSVQLFVQRISLGLEYRGPTDSPIALFLDEGTSAPQWRKWMRTYAVWRAARVVFLYPESYLDLSLRDDKTPPFLDFEKALTQGEVSADVIADALRGYVTKLEQVGLLEVVALCEDASQATKTIHFIARTRATPSIHYYRSLSEGAGWTPWEKLDLDISGDHLIPVVHDGTLYLFWVLFHEKQEKASTRKDKKAATPPQPKRYFELELAWSERKVGKWTAKRVGRQKIRTNGWAPATPVLPTSLNFRAAPVSYLWSAMGEPVVLAPFQQELCILCVSAANEIGWWVIPTCGGDWPYQDVGMKTRDRDLVQWKGGDLSNAPTPTSIVAMQFVSDEGEQGLTLPAEPLFDATPEPYSVAHSTTVASSYPAPVYPPLVFQDAHRAYVLLDNATTPDFGALDATDPSSVVFGTLPPLPVGMIAGQPLFHPYACEFLLRLQHGGVDQLYQVETQSLAGAETEFDDRYEPTDLVALPYPRRTVDFAPGGSYSIYNWELFLWAPLRIAQLLAQANRFEEALDWYHRVYDPRDPNVGLDKEQAWRFAPFRNRQALDLIDLLALLDYKGADPQLEQARTVMKDAVEDWRRDPFQPFKIARHRPTAFMRMVKIEYVELLIAYGDSLFSADTIESVNIATQVYSWALTQLGPRPEQHPSRGQVPPHTYDELRSAPLDAFSNALVKLEGFVPTASPTKSIVPVPLGFSFYFCVPPNDRLLVLWDKLEDRLHKIRHCQNLQGVERQLALFDGYLDPSVLIAANAAGLDLNALAATALTPLPVYRFPVLLQKAMEVANDLRAFGSSVLSVIEKRDAEALSALRQRQEREVLDAVRRVKERQIDETKMNLEALQRGREIAQARSDFYGSREFMNTAEKAHIGLTIASTALLDAAIAHDVAASILAWVPEFQIGIQGIGATPTATISTGGGNMSQAISHAGSALRGIAGHLSTAGSISATIGAYQRRSDDWELQKDLADRELAQIDQHIAAAELRIDIATRELENHDLQIQHSREVDDFLHGKLSSLELYEQSFKTLVGLHGRLRTVALNLARRAQDSYRFERVDGTATFLSASPLAAGVKATLLSGEELITDLREMEAAYLDSNRRELELVRHISLAVDFPDQLVALTTKGSCEIELTEEFFDRQLPGHYMRRIKTAALSIACIVGPSEPVHAKLTLLSSKVRRDANVDKGYEELPGDDEKRFRRDPIPIGPLVTSSAVNDGGMFEVNNFRDERLLWLEGAGAVGRYRIELPLARTDVDPSTVSDVTLHLRYTARDGGAELANAVPPRNPGGLSFFTARADFPDAWEVFTEGTTGVRTLTLELDRLRFPPRNRSTLMIKKLSFFWKGASAAPPVAVKKPSLASVSGAAVSALPLNSKAITINEGPGRYVVTFTTTALPEDAGILVEY